MTMQSEPVKIQEGITGWYLQSLATPAQSQQRYSIVSGRTQIGRRPELKICLSHSSVSKLHAEIVASDVALFVRDLGSTNGTFVNGKRITEDTLIGERDIVHFAEFEFVIGRAEAEQINRTMVSSKCDWQSKLLSLDELLNNRSVVPYFQPIVQFSDLKPIGYEVLARSDVPGLANPRDMFGAAEHFSVATKLSVICRENGVETGRQIAVPGKLFLNTHPEEKPHKGLVDSLKKLRSQAPNAQIVIELHEAAITDSKEIAEFFAVLRDLNMELAYDDFGAGQARLMELSEVTPDYLKFDMGLIRNIHLAPQRQQVVAGLVQVACELGIQPLAEGIEHPDDADVCQQIGFTLAQGFLFGRPEPVKSFSS